MKQGRGFPAFSCMDEIIVVVTVSEGACIPEHDGHLGVSLGMDEGSIISCPAWLSSGRKGKVRAFVCIGTNRRDIYAGIRTCRQIQPGIPCLGMVIGGTARLELPLQENSAEKYGKNQSCGKDSIWKSAHLSGREIEVASLTASGLTGKEIAWKLGLSESTVIAHRRNIYRKTGFCSVSQLTAWMARLEIC